MPAPVNSAVPQSGPGHTMTALRESSQAVPPETERQSHYFPARLGAQFDAVIHVDHTGAVEPLEPTPVWVAGEPPETFPTGL